MGHIFQAIVTKYLGPTNSRGSRIKATAQAGSITVSYDHALNTEENHLAAAAALANKYDWLAPTNNDGYGSRLEGGALPSGDGNCYVIVSGKPDAIVSMGDWRDVAIDALQSQPDDAVRAGMRAINVIAAEIGADKAASASSFESPLARFGRMGTWTYENSVEFLLNGVAIFTIQSAEYDRRRKLGHADVGDIAEAVLDTLQRYAPKAGDVRPRVELRTPRPGERGWWVEDYSSPEAALAEVQRESGEDVIGFPVEVGDPMLRGARPGRLIQDENNMVLVTVFP